MKPKPFLVLITTLLACLPPLAISAPGDVDQGFAPSLTGGGAKANVILVQPDGKILIGGNFLETNGVARTYLSRLNADGSLDVTFSPNPDGEIYAMALQSDGRILISGAFFQVGGQMRRYIARLEPNGVVDSQFNINLDGWPHALAIEADGSILFSGNFSMINEVSHSPMARVSGDGVLDASFSPTFGGSGFVFAQSIKVMSDGRILAGGDFNEVNGEARSPLIRLNADGSTDASFNVSIPGGTVFDFLEQPDGRILVGGSFEVLNGEITPGLARLNSNGTTDEGFNPDIPDGGVQDIILQPDGKVLALGGFPTAFKSIVRFLPDGGLDFAYAPQVTLGTLFVGALLPDGRLIIGGTFTAVNGVPRSGLARLGSDGSLEVGFNPDAGEDAEVEAVVPRGDGGILLGGTFTTMGGNLRGRGAEVTPEGAIKLFNARADGTIHCLLVQRDGKIVVGGSFTTVNNGQPRPRLARFLANGTLDTAFNPAPDDEVHSIVEAPDGDLYIGGKFLNVAGTPRQRLARLNSDGTIDTAFANPAADAVVWSIALQPDGMLVVGGQFVGIGTGVSARLARLRPNGTLDPAFSPPGPGAQVFAVALQPDGKILIGGQFTTVGATSRLRLARLQSNGIVDATFQSDADNTVAGIAIQADGRLLVAGTFTTIDGVARHLIAQLDSDGTVDGDFEAVPNAAIGSLSLDLDGSVLVGGIFTSIDGVPRRGVARLLNDPAIDTLTVASPQRIEWLRGGSAPETSEVVFEISTDGGTTFFPLADAYRIPGGWELDGLSLPDAGIVRARARVRGGLFTGSGGWVTSTRLYQFTPRSAPSLTIKGKKKILTSAKKITVKGTASDPDGDLATVRFIDSRERGRAFRGVKGLAAWSARAVLKSGRNKVLVEAKDATGRKATRSVTIVRK